MLRRGARDRDDQTSVVDQLTVVGKQPAIEAVAPNGRSHLRSALG